MKTQLSPQSPTRKAGMPSTDHARWSISKMIGHLKAHVRRDYGGKKTDLEKMETLIKRMRKNDKEILKHADFSEEQLLCVAILVDNECHRLVSGIRKRQSHINSGMIKKVTGEL